jgi:transposase
MLNNNMVVGLDVHKKTIVVAVLYPGSDAVNERFIIENTPENIEKLTRRLAAKGKPVFCYEAGPCGYTLQRQMKELGFVCEVIAPALTPRRPGDRVKTDRRDAEKLARLFRAGELTVIRIPTQEEEAIRDLVRVREDVLGDRLRARHRLSKFLLRHGCIYQETKSWGVTHREWLRSVHFEWNALQQTFDAYVRDLDETQERLAELDQQVEDLAKLPVYQTSVRYLRCLKGIDTLSAMTLVAEIQDFERFQRAPSFMAYTGLVSSEYSSGQRVLRGAITKTGNAHVRRILVEAAWHARLPSMKVSHQLAERREGCPLEVRRIAYRAQRRLYRKYWRLIHRGKRPSVTVVACARELAGFVWAISRHFPMAPQTA